MKTPILDALYEFEHRVIPSIFQRHPKVMYAATQPGKNIIWNSWTIFCGENHIDNPYVPSDFKTESYAAQDETGAQYFIIEQHFPAPEEAPLLHRAFFIAHKEECGDPSNLRMYFVEDGRDELAAGVLLSMGYAPDVLGALDTEAFLCTWDATKHVNYGQCGAERNESLLRALDVFRQSDK